VKKPQEQNNASTGSFTVDCGENQNGHFNPDNFIAQPGVKNGAQHLHDYVGNLTTNADSNNQSLLKGGTTCKNGDQSAYFWPVIRIDTADKATQQGKNQKAKQDQAKAGLNQNDNQQAQQDQNNQDQNAQDQNAQDQNNQNNQNAQGQNGQYQQQQNKQRRNEQNQQNHEKQNNQRNQKQT